MTSHERGAHGGPEVRDGVLQPAGDLLHVLERHPRPHLRPDRHGRGEADLVQALVHAHLRVGDRVGLRDQGHQQRGGGIPDLFLWNPKKKEVMFSEVKSENDRLSDTQRLWIHVLTGAGIKVELCNAVAREVRYT